MITSNVNLRKTMGVLVCLFMLFPLRAASKEADIEKIFVVFKTHLDIGFTELSGKVTDTYHHHFIPAALDLTETLAKDSLPLRYSWTTGSWLIWDYLERADDDNRQRMEQAIRRGDFGWHALPFTMQVELCDSVLMSAAFSLSETLDRRFGRKTIAAKVTDVPGVTIAMIPLLKQHGISLLHLGSNPGAAVPELPEIFRWKDAKGAGVNVIYQTDYGIPFRIPGTKNLVILNFTHDNHGPHSRQQVEKFYARLNEEYPNAEILPVSMNEIAKEIEKVEASLPVVTSEWGDTWAYGTASDPKKVAEFRQLVRLRNKWLAEGRLVAGSETDLQFVVPLLLVAEHTCGLDVKSYLGNYDRYEFDKHPEFLQTPVARYIEKSWNEQRAYLLRALSALPADLEREALEALTELTPRETSAEGMRSTTKRNLETKYFKVGFDSATGSICSLVDKRNGKQWADASHQWGELAYQIYSGEDFARFIGSYCPKNPAGWMLADYGKPGLDKLSLKNETVNYTVDDFRMLKDKRGVSVDIHLALKAEGALYGAPRKAVIRYSFPNDKPEIHVELNWFDKAKNRIPEAVWFSFHPILPSAKMYVDKMGTKVDVQQVVYNGARTIHGVTDNVSVQNAEHQLCVRSLDACLVQFNKRNLLAFDNEVADPEKGMNFCLLNTLWGTNYPQWFGDDMKYRFVLSF